MDKTSTLTRRSPLASRLLAFTTKHRAHSSLIQLHFLILSWPTHSVGTTIVDVQLTWHFHEKWMRTFCGFVFVFSVQAEFHINAFFTIQLAPCTWGFHSDSFFGRHVVCCALVFMKDYDCVPVLSLLGILSLDWKFWVLVGIFQGFRDFRKSIKLCEI